MFNPIRDTLSELASSDNEEDGEDQEDDEEDTELPKLSEDDEPGWAMATNSNTVHHHHMETFQQKQMRLDKLMQPGWEKADDSSGESDMKYETAELMVPAVVKPQTAKTAATPSPTTFEEHMQTLDIVPGQSQILQGTSQPGSSQMRLCSGKSQSKKGIISLPPGTAPNSSTTEQSKHGEHVIYHPCI